MSGRVAKVERSTRETKISLALDLDGSGVVKVETGIGFLDHLLTALATHARFDLDLACEGDLHVDDHHTAEDCGLMLGAAIDQALGERKGIMRFGSAFVPLDEALSRAVVDLSGRPFASVELQLTRPMIGALACENIGHVIASMAMKARACVHVDVIKGVNDHHKAESAFKALAAAMREAVRVVGGGVPSTKGVL